MEPAEGYSCPRVGTGCNIVREDALGLTTLRVAILVSIRDRIVLDGEVEYPLSRIVRSSTSGLNYMSEIETTIDA